MPTNKEIENELSRLAQLVQEPDATVERDTTVISTLLPLNAASDTLQTWAYAQTYFMADRAYEITSIREVHDTAQTFADGTALQIAKITGTSAPSVEADQLTLITNVAYSGSDFTLRGFDQKGIVANTVTNGTMTNQVSSLRLASGDRLVWGINGSIATTFISLTTVLKKI